MVLGYFAHLEPLGSLHWDTYHLGLGVLFALPIIALDALIMLPDWDPPKIEKNMKMVIPKTVAHELKDVKSVVPVADVIAKNPESTRIQVVDADKPRPEMVQVERSMMVRGEQSPVKDALRRIQLDRVMNNAGQVLNPFSEGLLLLLVHLSEEMLYRGIALTFVVKWTTDRLYEAVGEDTISIANRFTINTDDAGAVVASVTLVCTAVYLLLRRDLNSLKVIENIEEQAKVNEKDAKISNALMDIKKAIMRQQKWSVGITATSEVIQWGSATVSYLITGNLLTPLVGAILSDGICSYWQRKKLGVIRDGLLQDAAQRKSKAQERSVLVNAIKHDRAARKAKDDGNNSSQD